MDMFGRLDLVHQRTLCLDHVVLPSSDLPTIHDLPIWYKEVGLDPENITMASGLKLSLENV
jgi:hypothetical protein